jgi:hypothetical protein
MFDRFDHGYFFGAFVVVIYAYYFEPIEPTFLQHVAFIGAVTIALMIAKRVSLNLTKGSKK